MPPVAAAVPYMHQVSAHKGLCRRLPPAVVACQAKVARDIQYASQGEYVLTEKPAKGKFPELCANCSRSLNALPQDACSCTKPPIASLAGLAWRGPKGTSHAAFAVKHVG